MNDLNKKITIKPLLAEEKYLRKYLNRIDMNRYYSNFGPLYNFTTNRVIKDLKLKKQKIVFTSSGHSSLMACCLLLKQKTKKKYMLTTSFNFFSAPQVILQSGFEPYFLDINLRDFSLNFKEIDTAILKLKNNIAGIIIPSPFGFNINIKDLNYIQKKYNFKVIYDAADTFINFDRTIDDSKVLICCSFHPTKTLPGNESGAIFCNRKYEKVLKSIISFGFYGKKREAKYLGFNGKFSEYDAAIFNSNYDQKKKIKKKISDNINYFYRNFKKLNKKKIFLQNRIGNEWITSKLCFYSNLQINFLKKKFNKFQIEIYSAWNEKPMHMHKLFQSYKKNELTNTLKLYKHFFTIPFNFDFSKGEINAIIKAIDKIFD